MLEFAILLHLRRSSEESVLNELFSLERTSYPNGEIDGNHHAEDLLKNNEKPAHAANKFIKQEKKNFLHNSHKIDYIAIFVFGISFCAFNSVYWVYYLSL